MLCERFCSAAEKSRDNAMNLIHTFNVLNSMCYLVLINGNKTSMRSSIRLISLYSLDSLVCRQVFVSQVQNIEANRPLLIAGCWRFQRAPAATSTGHRIRRWLHRIEPASEAVDHVVQSRHSLCCIHLLALDWCLARPKQRGHSATAGEYSPAVIQLDSVLLRLAPVWYPNYLRPPLNWRALISDRTGRGECGQMTLS